MMDAKSKRPMGMAAFTVIWAGQICSLLGTAMANFGLTLWAYEVTGRATRWPWLASSGSPLSSSSGRSLACSSTAAIGS